MDELELLKRDWQRGAHRFTQVSEQDIYKMLHRSSSSIVRWILIISILEILLWTGIGLCFNRDELTETSGGTTIGTVYNVLEYVNYAVTVGFIVLFYRNYRMISTTASTRALMKTILLTRKTVQYYVYYNLVMISVAFVSSFVMALLYSPQIATLREKLEENDLYLVAVIVILLVVLSVAVLVFWLFYRLVYGILLRKLYNNYNELKKIDL